MTDRIQTFAKNLNDWGRQKVPFVFMVDYAGKNPMAWQMEDLPSGVVRFNLNGFTNSPATERTLLPEPVIFQKQPVPFKVYKAQFDYVLKNIKAGNSFLVNLSSPTPIQTNLSLTDIFSHSEAPYRFLYKNEFVCFSPEVFVRINGNRISSFPMKGTIDAAIPNAEKVILSDEKEAAEHATIVDLIRNDLSMVAGKVWVERYRYVDCIHTSEKTLLQVSSEIAGILPPDFDGKYGDLLLKLLPAGSITGAPKPSTLRIIDEAEGYERGYYTGVMGYFDGENFESAVMIRFIENQDGHFFFKSGGGITSLSQAENEYQELIDKIYLPFSHVLPTML